MGKAVTVQNVQNAVGDKFKIQETKNGQSVQVNLNLGHGGNKSQYQQMKNLLSAVDTLKTAGFEFDADRAFRVAFKPQGAPEKAPWQHWGCIFLPKEGSTSVTDKSMAVERVQLALELGLSPEKTVKYLESFRDTAALDLYRIVEDLPADAQQRLLASHSKQSASPAPAQTPETTEVVEELPI